MSDPTVDGHDGESPEGSERPDDHFEDLDDGCGCAEVWDYLSERRDDGADDEETDG